jgi:hypothetical protein
MKKLLIAIALFCFSTGMFAQQPTTALEMNDYLVTVMDSIYAKGAVWTVELNTAEKTSNYNSLAPVRKNIAVFIDKEINDIKGLNEIASSAEFCMAMINFLSFEKKMISEAFMPFEKLTASSTETEKKKLFDNLTALSLDESNALNKVRQAQTAYAAKNGFIIENDTKEK